MVGCDSIQWPRVCATASAETMAAPVGVDCWWRSAGERGGWWAAGGDNGPLAGGAGWAPLGGFRCRRGGVIGALQ